MRLSGLTFRGGRPVCLPGQPPACLPACQRAYRGGCAALYSVFPVPDKLTTFFLLVISDLICLDCKFRKNGASISHLQGGADGEKELPVILVQRIDI